ncbi:LADA_0D02916g1_1 [Lachancea dasiensis]|uniref:LADA_0D02916g1_1 n=1 Tax=Lachancea dasiensis TaxID=1072105 RepID=A0A1G4J4T2_9SACH|nr:LADA_0D02916g1_1 [Lachancea dasiensis]
MSAVSALTVGVGSANFSVSIPDGFDDVDVIEHDTQLIPLFQHKVYAPDFDGVPIREVVASFLRDAESNIETFIALEDLLPAGALPLDVSEELLSYGLASKITYAFGTSDESSRAVTRSRPYFQFGKDEGCDECGTRDQSANGDTCYNLTSCNYYKSFEVSVNTSWIYFYAYLSSNCTGTVKSFSFTSTSSCVGFSADYYSFEYHVN